MYTKSELFMSFLLLGVALCGLYFFDKASCERKGKSFEDVEYSILGGCMVKRKGAWLPLDNIRGFGDENETR